MDAFEVSLLDLLVFQRDSTEPRHHFQIRMQFLTHLRRLTSAAQSINKVVTFLIKHSSQASSSSNRRPPTASSSQAPLPSAQEQDLWACIIEELEKSNINARINIFYMLDSLLDQAQAIGLESYTALVERDLETVVDLTVPTDVKEGVLNRLSTVQVSSAVPHHCLSQHALTSMIHRF